MTDLVWHVAHLRPRTEKKVSAFCLREGIAHTLPLYRSVKRYRGKQLVFFKPLFPNYLFLQIAPALRSVVQQHDHVANLLEPPDQAEFVAQLGDILRALDGMAEVRLAPQVTEGLLVRIKSGPLRGLEGLVVQRQGMMEVVLRLDFIGQAAAVKVMADEVEAA